ncbi:hypothetical protein SAMN05421821_101304 [Mucilaginibacter lappiensis]|uniref:Uncharacterized protein n=1 Tax=Mucilaginibacter lappiensis TaxID=354630 RepID=A0ABR6PDH2_9SPHI|nr:hypothetical protein [Mucilaginibacter lappiensis]MBB6107782.1 hypothetical protein [Mucilaginibacter lappiensis]SIP97342.1 hypothetical protein SAMN05421821_101304 [Mucilaginibacter lappiensis]
MKNAKELLNSYLENIGDVDQLIEFFAEVGAFDYPILQVMEGRQGLYDLFKISLSRSTGSALKKSRYLLKHLNRFSLNTK